MGSSWTRARTCVPCTVRQILNHCTTREVPVIIFLTFKSPFLIFWNIPFYYYYLLLFSYFVDITSLFSLEILSCFEVPFSFHCLWFPLPMYFRLWLYSYKPFQETVITGYPLIFSKKQSRKACWGLWGKDLLTGESHHRWSVSRWIHRHLSDHSDPPTSGLVGISLTASVWEGEQEHKLRGELSPSYSDQT